jgi:uncharacterized protein YxeA
MIDLITTIIALLAILAGISGIFAISENINAEEENYKIKEERTVDNNDEIASIKTTDEYFEKFSRISNSVKTSSATSNINSKEHKLILYPDHGVKLSNQYLQSTINSHVEGERSPPIEI